MNELAKSREEIDRLDKQLLNILSQRFKLTRQIGLFKKEHDLPMKDPQREAEMIKKRLTSGQKLKLSPIFIEKIFKLIVTSVVRENERLK